MLKNLRVRTKLALVLGAGLACASLAMAVSAFAARRGMVGGPVYGHIAASKDLVADVLPPPQCVIEAELLATQLVLHPEAERRLGIPAQIRRLEAEHEERCQYWLQELRAGELRDEVARAGTHARALFRLCDQTLVPQIEAGDLEGAKSTLERIDEEFREHRQAIDRVVVLARAEAVAGEEMAQDWYQLGGTILPLFSAGVMAALWGAGWMTAHRLGTRVRAISDAVEATHRGDRSHVVDTGARDELGNLAQHFNLMLGSIALQEQQLREALESSEKQTQELMRAKAAAESANIVKSEFLAKMSHELRTPLAGVTGMTELLSATTLTEDQKRMLKTLRTSSGELLSLVSNVLDAAEMQSGTIELSAAEGDALALAESVADQYRAIAETKGIELDVVAEDAAVQSVVLDQSRFRQMVGNFVSNAVRFTATGRVSVRLSTKEAANGGLELLCQVMDTGCGLAQEKLDTLFRPFLQGDNSWSRAYGGAGLGLAIVRELAGIMGGTTGAESTVGRGSTFWFSICCPAGERAGQEWGGERMGPGIVVARNDGRRGSVSDICRTTGIPTFACGSVAEARVMLEEQGLHSEVKFVIFAEDPAETEMREALAEFSNAVVFVPREREGDSRSRVLASPLSQTRLIAGLRGIASAAPLGSSGSRVMNILVAEDNPTNAIVVRAVLERRGMRVTTVGDGAEAVRAAAGTRFDLILMDCQMPGMDGFEATEKIRAEEWNKRLSRVPIIALTANAMKGDDVRCFKSGMDEYVTKPLNPGVLFAAIDKLCQKRVAA